MIKFFGLVYELSPLFSFGIPHLGHFTVEADFGILIVNDMLSVLLKVQSLISAVLSIFVACDSPVHSFLARLDEVQEELLY